MENMPVFMSDTMPILHEDSLHRPYFNILRKALSAVCAFYRADEKINDYQTSCIADYFRRLLFTAEVLEMKYSYRHEIHNSMWIDILGSGLPALLVIGEISADLENKAKRLTDFPKREILLQFSLDFMFKTASEPEAILWQLAESSYLHMLDKGKLFLPFIMNDPVRDVDAPGAERSKFRTYQVAWGCYDFLTNRPYVHLMKFHQDADLDALEDNLQLMGEVRRVIAGYGSKASDVGIMAYGIDEAIEWLHPKYLKRISLGPFYTKAALDAMPREDWKDEHEAAYAAISTYGTEEDYLLFFDLEIVFSQGQNVTKGESPYYNRIRERFFLPEIDLESHKRHASVFEPHVLLSHTMLQSLMRDELADRLPLFRRSEKVTYDERGVIHVFK